MTDVHANRLAEETSPYLLQHAHNPVDWYPWGEEALARASAEDKPILLSIGYAACHWCHVMERESFEDPETAALMNKHFVSVKVDREERPDLDSIYMDAVQAMTGSGGWPLTAFLTPDGKPFFAGTYYPPEPRQGMPAFRQVLAGIADAWQDKRDDVLQQGSRVVDAIARAGRIAESPEPLSDAVIGEAFGHLQRVFDERWGGFGGAPKFPQPMTLEFVLGRAVAGAPGAMNIVTTTLDRMAAGGMYDQLGGGFARYSTDPTWHVPHFEKMLYDNAQLAQLYVRAWQVTGDDRYRAVATETLDYLVREMQHPAGGFWSSQDADSEGVEGKFFTWTWDELVSATGPAIAKAFGATPEGNWEGTNVLGRPSGLGAVAAEEGIGESELATELNEARRKLFEIREGRVHPGTDDKVLTAWNALAIAALAEAGRAFGSPELVEAAVRCADFVLAHLRDDDGRLLRSWRDGVPGKPGYCDDYALLAAACLVLYQTTFELRWFESARSLADDLLRLFRDEERGGFFTTGSDQEALVVRPKDLYDNAVPSGNSVAADVLQRMALLTGDDEYERAGVSALRVVRDSMAQAPTGFGHALCALDLYVGPSREVAVIGEPSSEEIRAMVAMVNTTRYRPNVVLAVAAENDDDATSKVALLRDRPAQDGRVTAYVCERFVCKLPVTDPVAVASALDA
ncbi:MAG TPA: thioredoxin domain-containing protein [Actinomycetota bacterium]|nr:thioredoxin domain-containing protein [Actinomycetota bacterium]